MSDTSSEQLVGALQTEVTDLRGVVAELRRDGDAPGGGVDMFKGEMSTSYYAAVQRALVAENSTSPSGIGASPVRLALHTALVSFLISITLVGLHSAKDAMARRGTLTSFNDYAAVADQAEWADDRVMANSDTSTSTRRSGSSTTGSSSSQSRPRSPSCSARASSRSRSRRRSRTCAAWDNKFALGSCQNTWLQRSKANHCTWL